MNNNDDVVRLDPDDPRATVCGDCGAAWDDSVSTSRTPTPAGRCPFEYDHDPEPMVPRMSNYEIVAWLRRICDAATDENGEINPLLIARDVEHLADEICNRNDLGEAAR